MNTRKGQSVVRLMVLSSVVVAFALVVIYLSIHASSEDQYLSEKVLELTLPSDFSGKEVPAVSFSSGYFWVTYTDKSGEYRTARYGYYPVYPIGAHWVKPEEQK
jgi:hypothetical protein